MAELANAITTAQKKDFEQLTSMFGQLMQKLDLQPPQNSGGRAPTIAMEAIPRHRAPEELGSSQESRVSIVDANIAAPMHNAGNSRPTLLQGQSHGSPLLNAEPQGILIDGVWGGAASRN